MSIGTPHAADLTLVVVHYHTPELARAAVDGLLELARAERVALELVVVDNGSDESGRAVLQSLAQSSSVRVVEPGRNLGYAGAANLGLREGAGAALGVMNPDVVVLPGCMSSLLRELAAGTGVAGPLFHWDEGRRMLIPPAEPRGRLAELLLTLGRFPKLGAIARRYWRRHARRHWLAPGALPSIALIGALLAFRRDAWQAVGEFDEGYRLYFEETDWLVRARSAGQRTVYLPGAAAVHLFDQSAGREPRSREWFAESARRFRRRHYGTLWSTLLARLERAIPPASAEPAPAGFPSRGPSLLGVERGEYWFETSPFRHGYPAAAERWTGDPAEWRLPAEIRERHSQLELHLRIVDARGRERAWFVLPSSAAQER